MDLFERGSRSFMFKNSAMIDARYSCAKFSSYSVTHDNQRAFGIAKKYVELFDDMLINGQGLLFYGPVGTGKTYTAATIANELLDQKRHVLMTSFVKLLQYSTGYGASDQYKKCCDVSLLVIDDLGAERGTDFAVEKVYNIIDGRYRSKKPLILTTNLEMDQLKNNTDIRYARIYDRVFEMCYPVRIAGLSWRKREAASRFQETKKLLEE